MHNKFCIIDEEKVISGSLNPTKNGVKNRNNLIIIKSRGIAGNYKKEFEEMWGGVFEKGERNNEYIFYLNNSRIENYFCPEDECAKHIKERIKNAEKSVYFMQFSFTNDGIANSLLLRRYEKGIEVKGVFDKRINEYSKFNLFSYQGIEVKRYNCSKVMHHKVFIIDNKTVITGSMNPTKRGDLVNDENILIIDDKEIAQDYLDEFNYLWENCSNV